MPGQEKMVSVNTAPVDQIGEGEADDGERRDERVAERMVDEDPRLARPFRAGGENVVLVEHVEHVGPHQARDRSSTAQPSTKAGRMRCESASAKTARSPASSESIVRKPVTPGGGAGRASSRPGPGNLRAYEKMKSRASPDQNTGRDEPKRAKRRAAWSSGCC